MIRFSVANLVTLATIAASSAATAYPAANVATPERPFTPWRSGGGTPIAEQTLTLDFGATVALGVIALVRANFLTATVQGHATNSWGSPSYSEAIQTGREPTNTRYGRVLIPSGTGSPFNYRWLRLVIAAQTPLDGAAYFLLGGLWAGAWLTTPRGVDWSYTLRRIEPHTDVQPPHAGWLERSRRAEPIAFLTAHRKVTINHNAPGSGDDFGAWQEIDRQLLEADKALTQLDTANVYQGWVMRRREDPEWTVNARLAESPLALSEITGP
jgi:hypothetical protein